MAGQLVRQHWHVIVHFAIVGRGNFEGSFVDLVYPIHRLRVSFLLLEHPLLDQYFTYHGLRFAGPRGAETEFAEFLKGWWGEGVEAGFGGLVNGLTRTVNFGFDNEGDVEGLTIARDGGRSWGEY